MTTRAPVIGAAVYTSDGEEVGEVKEVREGMFKIDAPKWPDFWLDDDDCMDEANDAHGVLLKITLAELPEHMHGGPDGERII